VNCLGFGVQGVGSRLTTCGIKVTGLVCGVRAECGDRLAKGVNERRAAEPTPGLTVQGLGMGLWFQWHHLEFRL